MALAGAGVIVAGPAWCDRYPTSREVMDLVEPFRARVRAFLGELAKRGCQVHVAATRRPPERAYLMHWAWMVAREGVAPADVPAHDPPIPIAWTLDGARAMVAAYGLAYRPSLTSRHIAGRAIDMTVSGWLGSAEELHELGASFGVRKLVSDPPHWSDDGR